MRIGKADVRRANVRLPFHVVFNYRLQAAICRMESFPIFAIVHALAKDSCLLDGEKGSDG